MVRAHEALAAEGLKTRTILQIHDELLFEGPPEEMERATEIVTREMVGAAELDPPLDGRRGRRAELARREVSAGGGRSRPRGWSLSPSCRSASAGSGG